MADYSTDPQVVPYLLYEDAGEAMDWLIKVFGFTERTRTRRATGRCNTASCSSSTVA